jgi:phospholipid/cholesterol/gamma-HCH transport system substrate-binding protein
MTHEQKVRLGIFLAVMTVVFVAVTWFFVVPKLREPGDPYVIDFRDTSVHGLFVGSPVKYRGVEVGKVVRIEVNPDDLDSVKVHARIRKVLVLKTDMTATLVYMGLTGQKYIEISGGTRESETVEPHGSISTSRGLGEKAEDIVSNIEEAVKSFNALLAPENLERFTRILENAEKSSETLSGVLESRRSSLENAISSFEKASLEFARASENLGPISEDFDRLLKSLESSSQKTLETISRRFSDEELGQAIQEVRAFLETASVSLKKVESVLLAQQAELTKTFANLGEAVENLSRFSREIAEDPTSLIRTRKEKKK